MLRVIMLVIISTLCLMVDPAAADDIPHKISYQGRLTDPAGQPVAGGAYLIRFNIYSAPTERTCYGQRG